MDLSEASQSIQSAREERQNFYSFQIESKLDWWIYPDQTLHSWQQKINIFSIENLLRCETGKYRVLNLFIYFFCIVSDFLVRITNKHDCWIKNLFKKSAFQKNLPVVFKYIKDGLTCCYLYFAVFIIKPRNYSLDDDVNVCIIFLQTKCKR